VRILSRVCEVDTLTVVTVSTESHIESFLRIVNLFRVDSFSSVEQKLDKLSERLSRILPLHKFEFHVESFLHIQVMAVFNLTDSCVLHGLLKHLLHELVLNIAIFKLCDLSPLQTLRWD
jgi:hypothetical protein